MQYIHLSNDSYIIHTTKGTYTLTRESFNFNKVKRLLSNNVEEEKILPLLEPPVLPDGIYKAYVIPALSEMYYMHITDIPGKGVVKTYKNLSGNDIIGSELDKLVGVYASKEDLILDWPEYTI